MANITLTIRIWLILCMSTIAVSSYAQVLNDDCQFATALPIPNNYCSDEGQFTNVGATPDPVFPNGCLSLSWTNGVWFSFVPKEPGVLIRVFGQGNGSTIKSPKIVVFEKCGDYLQCSPGKDNGGDELVLDDLNIGQTYFIMIESSLNGNGTFKLCVDDFIPTPSPQSDCKEAVILCDKSAFKIESLTSVGNNTNEIEPGNCITEEFASSWYKWTCDVSGPLTFVLTPNNYISQNQIADDLDFSIYELPGGIDDCANKKKLLCEASGANGTNGNTDPLSTWIKCNGPTGLRVGEVDSNEDGGCNAGQNSFIKPLDMISGKSYVLIVNNYSRGGRGFSIEFGGSGTFLGPKPDFEILAQQKFECDKTLTFLNTSTSLTDSIVSYRWNFGARSTPSRFDNKGPIEVVYSGFGDKTAALTVESSRGCTVTKIIDFFVEPCCKDTSTLSVDGLPIDPRCFGFLDGRIIAQGKSGGGEYQYSIDGINFQPNPQFNNLAPGDYNVYVEDLKGCRDTFLNIILKDPLPIVVDAGPDQEIDLGDITKMDGFFSVFVGLDTMNWTPDLDFDINGIIDPEVFPKNTTTYTYTVTDANGCTKSDQVTIRVNKSYEIFAPNIFSPLGKLNDPTNLTSPTNNYFNVWSTKGVKYIEVLEVYDRWGNLVYQDHDFRNTETPGLLEPSNVDAGWNGIFNGLPVNPGVFAWRARVRFIDDFVKEFTGDLTLVR